MRHLPFLPSGEWNLVPALRQHGCLGVNTMMLSRICRASPGTNHAGGVVGGISNGNELVYRIAIKPTSSTPKEQQTLNWETGEQENFSVKGRHDLCIALRVPPVMEAVTAIVLADLMMIEQKLSRIVGP